MKYVGKDVLQSRENYLRMPIASMDVYLLYFSIYISVKFDIKLLKGKNLVSTGRRKKKIGVTWFIAPNRRRAE